MSRASRASITTTVEPRKSSAAAAVPVDKDSNKVELQVGMVGDAEVGKTSLMVKYVQDIYNNEYTQTLGVNFLKKKVHLGSTEIIFSIFDLGGQKEFVNMLPLTSVGSCCVIFLFDLTRPKTLTSVREWFRQSHGLNADSLAILVGTKYDLFIDMDTEYQERISRTAMKYAQVMNAPLVFSSSACSINVQKIFKIIISKIFGLTLTVPEINEIGDPLLIYKGLGDLNAYVPKV